MNILEIIKEQDVPAFKEMVRINPRCTVNKTDGVWPAFEVALTGNLEMVKCLVEYSFYSLNHVDDNYNNVLHYAAMSGNLDCVKYLVERANMSPAIGNRDGVTPYDIAAEKEFADIVNYFEEKLGAPLKDMYKNPVARGMHPDPSTIRVGEYFYMVNSSFVYFPCIPVSRSKDLVNWEVIGHAITNPEYAKELEALEGGRGYWAPDISYFEGRFYITATLRKNDDIPPYRLQMVTSADKPEGPYDKPVFLDEDGIDPSIFTDVDKRRYMLLNRGARIFEISQDGKEILSEPELLWYGSQKRAPEGPHLCLHNGFYYLFVAEGGTGDGHRIAVSRSKTLKGPYEDCPYNPIMRQWDEDAPIKCCGHGKPIQLADGRWYIMYLCNRKIDGKYGTLGRETCLDPITWTPDGWPIVNQLQGPSMLQKKPFPEITAEEMEGASDIFPEEGRWGKWLVPRAPRAGSFRKEIIREESDQQGNSQNHSKDREVLYLNGDGQDLCAVGCRSVLLQNQADFHCEILCTMDFAGLAAGEDAGATCYYDENSYFKFGIVRNCESNGESSIENGNEDGYSVFVKEYVDDSYKPAVAAIPVTGNKIQFKITVHKLSYTCEYRTSDVEDWKLFTVVEDAVYLSSEGLSKGKRFTGAMAGIYLNGTSEVCFEDFRMKQI